MQSRIYEAATISIVRDGVILKKLQRLDKKYSQTAILEIFPQKLVNFSTKVYIAAKINIKSLASIPLYGYSVVSGGSFELRIPSVIVHYNLIVL